MSLAWHATPTEIPSSTPQIGRLQASGIYLGCYYTSKIHCLEPSAKDINSELKKNMGPGICFEFQTPKQPFPTKKTTTKNPICNKSAVNKKSAIHVWTPSSERRGAAAGITAEPINDKKEVEGS